MLPFRLISSRYNSKGKRISRNVRRLRLRSKIELLKNKIELKRRQSGWPKRQSGWPKNLRSKGLLRSRNQNERRKREIGLQRRRLRNESAVRKRIEISLQRSKKSAKRKLSANKRSLRRLKGSDQRRKINLPDKLLQMLQKERKRPLLLPQLSKLKVLVSRVSPPFSQQGQLNSNPRKFNKPISPNALPKLNRTHK